MLYSDITQYIRSSKYVHMAVACVNYIISTNDRRALITLSCLTL